MNEFEKIKAEAEQSAEALEQEEKRKAEDERLNQLTFPAISREELVDILGLSIKSDEHNKLATFLCMLSAFSENCAFNVAFSAPSSAGKSFIPLEISKLFPDVQKYGYASPTSFFHETTERKDDELVVDLERKILIFLDMPHYELLEKIRPLLSHDEKIMLVKITDRGKRNLRAKTIKVIGYPAVIFCSANLVMNEQESTRFMTLSPSIDQEKIRQSIIERIKKESDNVAYDVWLESDPRRKELKERICAIRAAKIDDVKIEPELSKEIEAKFLSGRKFLKPRHSRDVSRLLSLTKAFTLLNLWQRDKLDKTIIARKEDFENALWLWEKISESTELNLPPYILDLFKQVILPLFEGAESATRPQILAKHWEVYGRPLYDKQLKQEILPMLETAGMVFQERDPNDSRKYLIKLQKVLDREGVYTSHIRGKSDDYSKQTEDGYAIE